MTSVIYGVITFEKSRSQQDERAVVKQADDLQAGALALNLEQASPWPDQYPAGLQRGLTTDGRHEIRFCYQGTETRIEEARTQLGAYLEGSRYSDGTFGTAQLD